MLRYLILRRLLLISLFLGCMGGATKAQLTMTLVPDSILGFPDSDTVAYGDSTHYRFALSNTSNISFNDSIFIHLRTPLGTFLLEAFDTIFIPAQSAVSFDIKDNIQNQRYGGGVSIVVIWPTSPTPIFCDSLSDTLFVQFPDVVGAEVNPFYIKVFPNPTQDVLYLRPDPGMTRMRDLKILDPFGRVILELQGQSSQVDLSHLPAGIYFLHVTLETGQTGVLKVVRQR